MPSDLHSPSKQNWHLWLLLACVIAVYFPVCGHEFVSADDPYVILNNPAIAQPDMGSLKQIWRNPDPGLYIPVTYTLWWLLALIGRVRDDTGAMLLNPWVFHIANLIVHSVAAVLCLRLLQKLNCPAALLGALLFALHPVQVEVVAWATGMRDLLGGALALGALLLSVQHRRWSAAAVMLAAVLSKPSAIMVFPMALAIESLANQESFRSSIRRNIALLPVCLFGVGMTIWFQPQIHQNISAWWQRPLVALDAIAFYLSKLLLPVNLTFDYARRPASIVASGAIWWTWVFPVAICIVLCVVRNRVFTLPAMLFLLPIVPVLGLLPFAYQSISTVADHYLYLAMLGPALLTGSLSTRGLRMCVVVVLAAFGVLAHRQAWVWKDSRTLFTHAVNANPRSAPAWNGLAGVLFGEGDVSAAEQAARRSAQANPDYAFARLTLVMIYSRMQDRVALQREWDEFLRTYQLQANFDPKLAEQAKKLFDAKANP